MVVTARMAVASRGVMADAAMMAATAMEVVGDSAALIEMVVSVRPA